METKACITCKIEYPETSEYFYKRHDRENGLMSYCKKCFSNYQSKRHRDLKQSLLDYKGSKCVLCGYDKNNWNLTFHHLDPSKKEIGIATTKRSLEKLKKEVDKCVVVCHNCHGDIHHGLHPELLIVH